ncbi:5'-deoxynucleotidase [Paenibacillus thermoaerophilus]|uniref:5'-deoxynucleotidase n=1 Tax=Paenibacillus thermoaerophilus TaxID=1215385 RepID=A0ABW2V0U1_9BACL|nr:5'-deoxynucleotidase [Paenibacillus thermoaerophilus]TMV15998.1 5'-deoxynucleotidase [Paenibacillus thermoaerophilus]
MNSPFFAYMYRLRYIKRWSLMRSVNRENVAEHSYQVALLAHALCTIGNTHFGRSYPTERIVVQALFHDATEVITGDIPTPVKHHNREILRNFREIERLAGERLVNMVPPSLKPVYEPLVSGDGLDEQSRRVLKAADSLDAYLKCVIEQSAGNPEFAAAQRQIEQAMKEMAMPELDYFLRELAPAFAMTLDEMAQLEDEE